MRAATRKVIVSCFASSIPRIQQIVDIAAAAGRKIAFIGRSMVDNVELAHGMHRLETPMASSSAPRTSIRSPRRKW